MLVWVMRKAHSRVHNRKKEAINARNCREMRGLVLKFHFENRLSIPLSNFHPNTQSKILITIVDQSRVMPRRSSSIFHFFKDAFPLPSGQYAYNHTWYNTSILLLPSVTKEPNHRELKMRYFCQV